MHDIAAAVGISKAALYLQFASKEALFEAMVTELIETMLPQAAPPDFGDMPADLLLRQVIGFMGLRVMSPDMAFVPKIIIGEGANFPGLAQFYLGHVITVGLGLIARILRHGIARGEFACADVDQACRTIIGGVVFGAIWQIVFVPAGAEPLDPQQVISSHIDTVLNGLLVRKELA